MATVVKAKQEETSPQRQGFMSNVVSGLARERILEAEQLAGRGGEGVCSRARARRHKE